MKMMKILAVGSGESIVSRLQEVIDGTMNDNKKETDSETRRYGEGFCAGLELAQRYIRNADVQPVRRGKWINGGDFLSCSACGATSLTEFQDYYGHKVTRCRESNFCPSCGADMRGEGNE